MLAKNDKARAMGACTPGPGAGAAGGCAGRFKKAVATFANATTHGPVGGGGHGGMAVAGQELPVKCFHRDFEDLPVVYLRRDDINRKLDVYVCMQISGAEVASEVCGERETQKSGKPLDVTCPLPLQNWLCHYSFPYELQA